MGHASVYVEAWLFVLSRIGSYNNLLGFGPYFSLECGKNYALERISSVDRKERSWHTLELFFFVPPMSL